MSVIEVVVAEHADELPLPAHFRREGTKTALGKDRHGAERQPNRSQGTVRQPVFDEDRETLIHASRFTTSRKVRCSPSAMAALARAFQILAPTARRAMANPAIKARSAGSGLRALKTDRGCRPVGLPNAGKSDISRRRQRRTKHKIGRLPVHPRCIRSLVV